MWTKFMDMHSGGGTKEGDKEYIYIGASEDEAVTIFENAYGHSPYEVACECCGQNYYISEHETLELATAYERYNISLEDYLLKDSVAVIYIKN